MENAKIIWLPKIENPRGNLTFIEQGNQIPFKIMRVYFLYNLPDGERRGGHAHKVEHEFIIALNGAFDIILDDSREKKIFHLDHPYFGLHIIPGIWHELINFSSNAICLVLASETYDEDDYLRDYSVFIDLKKLTDF